MRNMISNRCMKIVVAVLCFSIIISCIFSEYRAFASFENGLADEQIDNAGSSKSHFFEGDGFSVEFNVTNEWNTGYIARIKVVNTGNEKITNWKLSFPFDGEIRNIWDADLIQHLENNYIVSNCGYNRNINSGEYVEFGFEGIGELDSFPGEYTLINETSEVIQDDYSINYYVENDWGGWLYSWYSYKK